MCLIHAALQVVRDERGRCAAEELQCAHVPLSEGHVTRRAATEDDSPFPAALADAEPDTWGKRIIQRAHAKRRQHDAKLGPLTRFDILTAVDDFSRVGALRLRDADAESYNCAIAALNKELILVDATRQLYRLNHATRGVSACEKSPQLSSNICALRIYVDRLPTTTRDQFMRGLSIFQDRPVTFFASQLSWDRPARPGMIPAPSRP